MTTFTATPTLVPGSDLLTPMRVAESLLATAAPVTGMAEVFPWLNAYGEQVYTDVTRVPLDDLTGWRTDPDTGDLRHDSGRFFTVEGLDVRVSPAPVAHWSQPILNQPEVGILGILVRELDGILHCLMQAKVEPGNCGGLQLSPTVQATRSNYTGVHRGRPVPYLEYFQDPARHRVLADARQSEQGAWFRNKRNRNMIVEVFEDVPVREGFCWLTLGQVHRLLVYDDLVNMDARSVLASLPLDGVDLASYTCADGSGFTSALLRSYSGQEGSRHGMPEILSWVTDARTRTEVHTSRVPLGTLPDWTRDRERISHRSGRFFDVIGVRVSAAGREVGGWCQPMVQPHGTGVVAFLARQIGGVLHLLVQARVERGYLDVVELAPTVQCTPDNYAGLPEAAQPRFLPEVRHAGSDRIRFSAVLSEEGGRFYHARNQYLVVETDADLADDHPDFRWMTVHQLVDLLRHSHYLNVEARTLLACLHSLVARAGGRSR